MTVYASNVDAATGNINSLTSGDRIIVVESGVTLVAGQGDVIAGLTSNAYDETVYNYGNMFGDAYGIIFDGSQVGGNTLYNYGTIGGGAFAAGVVV